MTHGMLSASGSVAVFLLLAPGWVAGQTTDTPRTAWGAPDLGGVWDYRSATPMTRPVEFKDKPILSEEEAAALTQERAAWIESLDSGENGAVAGAAIHTRVFLDFGINLVPDRRTSLIIDPPNGRHPLTVDGANEKRAAYAGSFGTGPFHSWEDLNLMDRCLGSIGFPVEPHPRSGLAQFSGDGRGHWEGDTLVVESMNFDGELTMISTEPRRLIERFTRVGDLIEYAFTVEDPDIWEAPWTAMVPLRKTEGPVFEYACHEGNYGLVNILSAARAEERAAAEASGTR